MDMKSWPDDQCTALTFSAIPFNYQISTAAGALCNLNAHNRREFLLDKKGVN
jgi:hypothetical protein